METEKVAVQLPFKGLVLSPDESPIAGIETIGQVRVMLLFTDKNMHCIPMPTLKFLFNAFNATGDVPVVAYPLSSLTGASGTAMGFKLKFEGDRTIHVTLSNLAPLLAILNACLAVIHGKELAQVEKKKWVVRHAVLGTNTRQQLQTQLSTLKREFLAKYTNPQVIHQLHAREARTSLFNALMAVVMIILAAIFLLRKCSP